MNPFTKSKKGDTQSLLAPRRKGLFGKKNERSEDAEVRNRSSSSGRLFRPPRPNTKHDRIVAEIPAFVPTPPVSPESSAPSDDQSNMSDLTEQEGASSGILSGDPPGKFLRSRSNESPVLVMKERMAAGKSSWEEKCDPEPSSPKQQSSIVQNLFSMMDKACVAPNSTSLTEMGQPDAIKSILSFNAEWGRAPSKDDDEDDEDDVLLAQRQVPETVMQRPSTVNKDRTPTRPAANASAGPQPASTVNAAPASSTHSPQQKHEKFEMVLREIDGQDDREVSKQGKKMRNPFAFLKENAFAPKPSRASDSAQRYPSEEEKKEEVDGYGDPSRVTAGPPPVTASSKAAAQKEARYKHLLGSWMNSKSPLETVQEGDENSTVNNEATELKVRVPGIRNPDAFISGNDLLGDECNISVRVENRGVKANQKVEKHFGVASGAAAMATALLPFRRTTGSKSKASSHSIRKSTTWIEKLMGDDESADGSGASILSEGMALKRQLSAPGKLAETPKNRPLWKAAVCPKSGRTYYYHRVTRRTTWTKPRDEDIINQRNDEDEIMVSYPADEGLELLRKKSRRDFDPAVWSTKTEIAEILKKMSPPDGQSVDRLMSQYEGREKDLLSELRDLAESRPFDEPVGQASHSSVATDSVADREELVAARSFKGRVRTHTSVLSGMSGLSASTQPITNTARGKPTRDGMAENQSHATSISSKHGDLLPREGAVSHGALKRSPSRVPSNIPVPRSRELNVEDYSSEVKSTKSSDMKGVMRIAKRTTPKHEAPDEKVDPPDISAYYGDGEETDGRETDTLSLPNDSISALSETDVSFIERKEAFDNASRRALDDAIAREDWDLAAALSQGMRTRTAKDARRKEKRTEWTQTELDRFISENDWDAVANYIAQVRDRNDTKVSRRRSHRSDKSNDSPRKRFGAKSQLQHTDLNHSDESWDSGSYSSYESEYSTASSYTDEESYRARRGKNFAC